MIAYLKYFLSAFFLLSVAPIYLGVWILLQLLMKICYAKRLGFILDEAMYASYQRFILFFFEIVTGTKLILYGDYEDVLTRKENIILFGNHQCLVDWVVVSMLAERAGTSGFVRFVLKQSLKFLPMYGYYFKQHGYLFVERSGNFKKNKFEEQIDQLSNTPHPIWLTLFPEGHRYNPENTHYLSKMKNYAMNHNLPVYDHLLTPRTKAFSISIYRLYSKLDAVYDMTFAFSSTLPPTRHAHLRLSPPSYFDLFKKKLVIHLHISRIPISNVPLNGDDFDTWLYSRYKTKDMLLQAFYSKDSVFRGTFGTRSMVSEPNASKVLTTAGIYLVCMLPWILSWHAFHLYLMISLVLGMVTFLVSSYCY